MTTLVLSAFLAVVANHLELIGTSRLPDARGMVKVETSHGLHGAARVLVRLDGMKPAALFGGDFNTYVVWLVPSDGRPQNCGEIPIEGDGGKLLISTTLQTFGVFVTAEPHFAVDVPSRFVVLKVPSDDAFPESPAEMEGRSYNYERSSLVGAKQASGPVHSTVKQAFTAVRLAERAGAITLAPEELRAARKSLQVTLELSRHGAAPKGVDEQARQTVELAATAQRLAESRSGSNYR